MASEDAEARPIPPATGEDETVHVAGLPLRIGPRFRQRCAWCGAVLIDDDLSQMAFSPGSNPSPSYWEIGGLVAVAGERSGSRPSFLSTGRKIDEETPDDPLPANACARLPDDVTV